VIARELTKMNNEETNIGQALIFAAGGIFFYSGCFSNFQIIKPLQIIQALTGY
jgi:hypothetical protein